MSPLIIFDCDGVLVDSEAIASAVFSRNLQRAGFDYSPLDCRQQFTGLSLNSCHIKIESATGRQLPEFFFSELQKDTFARFDEELQAVSGIADVLEFVIDKSWRYCVASSGSHDKMARTLGKTGLAHYFEGRIYSASDVARGKPAPDLFLHAAQDQGVLPAQCIVIEDSKPGVMAGLTAGMAVCVLGEAAAFGGAQVFSCMAELPAILCGLSAKQCPS